MPTVAAFVMALALEPVVETVGYGQVNAILMALVVVDVLGRRGRRWQGALVGVAVAIKLTPAVFLAYFLVRRDWRALAVAAGSAVACTIVGFLVAPRSSLDYWTEILFDPSRIGGLAYVSNQSLNGLLVRLELEDQRTLVWFLLCAALGLALLAAMRRLVAEGHNTAAMLMMGFYSLLASPVSWSHHWVWTAPALVLLVAWWVRWRERLLGAVVVSGLAIFVSRVVWLMPHEADRELHWVWWQHLVGNLQTLWGLSLLVTLWWYGRRTKAPGGWGAPRQAVQAAPRSAEGPGTVTRSECLPH